MGTHHRLTIAVIDIQGYCPVYHVGDSFRIEEGFKLVSHQPICMHSLQALNPYYVALSRGITPSELGIAGKDGAAYVQCLDPQRYTGGGTVTFRMTTDENVSRRKGGMPSPKSKTRNATRTTSTVKPLLKEEKRK